jgi:hypothetical protein
MRSIVTIFLAEARTPARALTKALSGSSSAVERQLPKLDVTGSIPVSRSKVSEQLMWAVQKIIGVR